MLKKRVAIITVATIVVMFAFIGCGSKGAMQDKGAKHGEIGSKKMKVALLLPGPINDSGWSALAYSSLKKVEAMGLETTYRENVSQSDMVEAFRAYATQGYDIICAHGFQFGDAAKEVAKQFPKIKFVVTSSTISQEPNLASIYVPGAQAGFVAGVVAGSVTKSGKVAYIGGMDIPAIKEPALGFESGVKYVNPQAEVNISFIGSWEDVAKGKEMALALINKGYDVVLGNANQASLGVLQAAVEKNILAVGYVSDQSQFYPNTVVASSFLYYPLEMVVKEVQNSNFKAQNYRAGINEGGTGIIWNKKMKESLAPEIVKKIEAALEDLKSGKIKIDDRTGAITKQ